MTNPNASLKHLFDLMDTNGSPQSFKNVMAYHWELEDQYKPSLLIKFHEKYATPTSSMELSLYKLVQRRVREILPQYMANFKVQDEILQADEEAESRKEALIQQLLQKQPMPDTEDTMERAGHMKMLTLTAEEIIIDEVVLKVR